MKVQNYRNHVRLVTTYHFLTILPAIALLIGSFVNLFTSSGDNIYSAALICLMSILLISALLHSRTFALKAQDRAIRAEENLRHFMLTQRPLDSRLTLSQVIALRFASDDELPALAARAAEEKLTNKQIKQAVTKWRADWYRV